MSPLLTWAIYVTLGCYALAMVLCTVRLVIGPASQDRILALDTLYNVGMLFALALGIRYASEMYFEAALLIALFGFVGSSAMAKFLLRGETIE